MVVGHNRNGSGFLLLKETIEFLNAENKIHFVVLSSFKSLPQNSVIAYTSPGLAGGFLSNELFRLKILSSWDAFSKKFCFPDVISENYFLSQSVLSFSEVLDPGKFHGSIKNSISGNSKEQDASVSTSFFRCFTLLTETLDFLFSGFNMHCVVLSLSLQQEKKISTILSSRGSSSKFFENENGDLLNEWFKFCECADLSSTNATYQFKNIAKKVEDPIDPKVVNTIKTNENCHPDKVASVVFLDKPKYSETEFIEYSKDISTFLNDSVSDDAQGASVDYNLRGDQANDLKINETLCTKLSFPCNICGKEFNVQSTMKRHLLQKHLKLQTISCEFCSQSFYRKDFLTEHRKLKHEGNDSFISQSFIVMPKLRQESSSSAK